MPNRRAATLLPSEPDVSVLEKLAAFDRFSLAVVIGIAVLNLAGWLFSFVDHGFFNSRHLMPPELSSIILMSALSLRPAGPRSSPGSRLRVPAAMVVTVLSGGILAAGLAYLPAGGDAAVPFRFGFPFLFPVGVSAQSAGGFALLGLTTVLMPARKRASSIAADFVTVVLFLTVLILVSGHLIATSHVFGPAEPVNTSAQSMACLLLLATTTVFRRAQHGVFSILLGHGLGSKIARMFSPVLIVLPYLREAGRARLIESGRMPANYTTAILASLNVVAALAILLYLAKRINRLESEINELSLRDALTELYNIRGFRLLANQALRLAHRSGQPFSVLFIDVDDLKKINDLLGHQAGSEFLIETGDILKNTFRETDVMGRIGGDEFAVAGQFTESAIAHAARRLEEMSELRNSGTGRKIGLRLSIGYATQEGPWPMTLDELLAKADEAMYEKKRQKKALIV